MKVIATSIPDLLLLEPQVYQDDRGFFLESYHEEHFLEIGIPQRFVQDNHSYSARHVLRGLHYQLHRTQGKLVRVVRGEVFDVAVDLRRSSKTFGRWFGTRLSAETKRILWIPPGFAHGFLTLSESADCLYKATDFYSPGDERTLRWNDPDLDIQWPIRDGVILSARDQQGKWLKDAECFD